MSAAAPLLEIDNLVVEIQSEGTAKRDRVTKAQLYARFGVGEYWIVDGEARQILRYTRADQGFVLAATAGAGEKLQSPLFPGLDIGVDEVCRPHEAS